MVYKIPKEEVRPLHFAYHSIFGMKEPIFCEEHLALLEENALLELRSDIPPYCVPIWLRKHKNGIFQVSFKVKLALSYCRFLILSYQMKIRSSYFFDVFTLPSVFCGLICLG